MEKIKRIPVIGYLLRVLIALCKLPKHVDLLYQTIDHYQVRLQEQDKLLQDLHCFMTEELSIRQQQNQAIEKLKEWNNDRMNDIRGVMTHVSDLENLDVSSDYIKKLNYLTSSNTTIWGPEEKLHISKLAAVYMCTFNTNSGCISVGDYTFAGMGVSILAGGHDIRLTGLLRRDADLKDGCDIEIGNGVWLASNSTILGPAKIGDNAVIAAGAVVTPGTIVPPGTVYGGVPAKQIAEISLVDDMDIENQAICEALKRSDGCLFVKGFSDKVAMTCCKQKAIGHIMTDYEGVIFTNQNRLVFDYKLMEDETCTLTIKLNGTFCSRQELSSEGFFKIVGTENDTKKVVQKVEIIKSNVETPLFLAIRR